MRTNICPSTKWSAWRAASRTTGLFSQLKEVYLFGCNTLNPQTLRSAPPRSRARSCNLDTLPADAERLSRACERPVRGQQPRPHAAHLQERSGDLRVFLGGAARVRRRRRIWIAIFAVGGRARHRKRPGECEDCSATFPAARWRWPAA